MPELPEVETVVRQLDQVMPGKVIESIEVRRAKSAQSDLSKVVGKAIAAVDRKAKYIFFNFQDGDVCLMAHLKMTGQLILDHNYQFSNNNFQTNLKSPIGNNLARSRDFLDVIGGDFSTSGRNQSSRNDIKRSERIVGGHPTADWVGTLPSKHTRVIIRFRDGSILYFNDQRVFGWLKVVSVQDKLAFWKRLPPDVIDPEFSVEYLTQVLRHSARPVKLVILDQNKMGGMGNIYANDALWLAEIDPRKPANKLSKTAVKALHTAMIQVLKRGIELGGASESTYKHINGMGGKYQEEYLIYKKDGEHCVRCGGVIKKIKIGGRGTYWCRGCQE